MRMKRLGVFLVGLFLIIAFLGVISAATISCSVKTSCSGGETRVMGLSDLTNAHGQDSTQSGYAYSLCCSGGGSCGADKIIKLSSPTNAHAEIPTGTAYSTNVCYGNLTCIKTVGNCVGDYSIKTISLSADTNAHIGNSSAYNTKICCKEGAGGPPATPDAYWAASPTGPKISSIPVYPGTTKVYMVVTGVPEGTFVSYNIKEKNTGIIPDDEIATKTATADGSGVATVEWTILQADLYNTPNDYDYFYFKTNVAGDSDGLTMIINLEGECDNINLCFDYKDRDKCNSNSCPDRSRIINNSITNGTGICADPRTNCRCEWINNNCTGIYEGITNDSVCNNDGVADFGEACDGDDLKGKNCVSLNFTAGSTGLKCNTNCEFDATGCGGTVSCPSNLSAISVCNSTTLLGKTCLSIFNITNGSLSCDANCQYSPAGCINDNITDSGSCHFAKAGNCISTSTTADNCNDGFLDYGLKSNWTWLPSNTFARNLGYPGMVQDASGWHCDGTNKTCVDSTNRVACPAQIELPFFGLMNFVIAVIAIALIYVALSQKKRKH